MGPGCVVTSGARAARRNSEGSATCVDQRPCEGATAGAAEQNCAASATCVVTPLSGIGERRFYRAVAQPFAAHAHGHYVIGLVEEGARTLCCNGETLSLEPGDVVVFNPGDVHGCQQSDGGVFAYDSVAVDAALLDGAVLAGPRVRDEEAIAAFREVVAAIDASSCLEGNEEDSVVLAAVLHLCDLLAEESTPAFPASAHDEAVQHALAHFCGHLAEPDSLGMLAAREGLSPSALIRAYRRRFAITPMRHLASLRVECAAHLLAQGVEPAVVAAEVGFADQAHLTRAFKQRLGTTPGAYQKMVRGRDGAAVGDRCRRGGVPGADDGCNRKPADAHSRNRVPGVHGLEGKLS